MKLRAKRKISTKPEGRVLAGDEFDTDRPEFFLSRGFAENASASKKKRVSKKKVSKK